jgi:hypothetical protein
VKMSEAKVLKNIEIERFGNDLCLMGYLE